MPRFVAGFVMASAIAAALLLLPGCADRPHLQAHTPAASQPAADHARLVAERFDKREVRIPMRDGVKLFTTIFIPKNATRPLPILLKRTPYGCRPYGDAKFPDFLGPSPLFNDRDYAFVYQDVRGRFMSEGIFENMRPHIDHKRDSRDIDESTDTYDTIDWLLKNVKNNNGRVGMHGISYPGFYCSAGMIDSHPALVASSPQAPVADWWFDDFFHNGAFFLVHAFNFMAIFDQPRRGPTTERGEDFKHGTPDGYAFFLNMGPLKNSNSRYFHNRMTFWNEMLDHPAYDPFWQARNILPHLRNIRCAVMTVGGWYDAEDLYGTFMTYRSIEKQNPGIANTLVIGPWAHGGWARSPGERLGNAFFGDKTGDFYRREIELRFFERLLRQADDADLPEAYVFETGANRWRKFDAWPPRQAQSLSMYLDDRGALRDAQPAGAAFDEFISDPARPVPFTEEIRTEMTKEYMTDDQRFASRRADVLTYQTAPLTADLTLAGPLDADLWVSTSASDADWVVKLIDVYPDGAKDDHDAARTRPLAGAQMMIRSEVLRGRYRNRPDAPEPMTPDEPTRIHIKLQDVLHTFRPGHRVMIQIQSTWFPLVDRNPQKYVPNIFMADEADFQPATHRVYHEPARASRIECAVLR
ncbi:MAG: CocE/NonD family hydrolase [Phycisphaerae bacterium]|nr:CocE/NonD family hydrolase [Phycisphaerae bacterium]